MLCWPFLGEQQTNCRYACHNWGVGMEINNNAKREETEALIKEIMGGEKGKELRKKALNWKESAGNSIENLCNTPNRILWPLLPRAATTVKVMGGECSGDLFGILPQWWQVGGNNHRAWMLCDFSGILDFVTDRIRPRLAIQSSSPSRACRTPLICV
ncbi:7-deoxyloganetin glucosyltransferase-like protein [Cinnamomum micranthum f. kanehirae]|uniref:7-deoxyloganetin glucosyltransferase-like protein n=1 Tax=Cinnamomum micranthum f. kanehirae TaxID=337451 RepID=A0A443PAY9_9MAGN|nr:7-deoxyloganetin glucosyltransferase-like protein [Cinnamomum micranthum f. kanehirae]